MCPNAGEPDEQVEVWTNIFATPIANRLNSLASGANLLPADIVSLMSLCAFESIALEKMSSWCEVFTGKEFVQYEYYSDVEKYYNRGYAWKPSRPMPRTYFSCQIWSASWPSARSWVHQRAPGTINGTASA